MRNNDTPEVQALAPSSSGVLFVAGFATAISAGPGAPHSRTPGAIVVQFRERRPRDALNSRRSRSMASRIRRCG